MSVENVEVVRTSLQRFSESGEIDWAAIDEEIEIKDHDIPDQSGYRGHEGFARWLEDWGAAWADYTIEPEYNTVDATLWFMEAIWQYFTYRDDEQWRTEALDLTQHQFYPALKSIINHHLEGTRYGIHADTEGFPRWLEVAEAPAGPASDVRR